MCEFIIKRVFFQIYAVNRSFPNPHTKNFFVHICIYRKRFGMTECQTYQNAQIGISINATVYTMLLYRREDFGMLSQFFCIGIQFSYAKFVFLRNERFRVQYIHIYTCTYGLCLQQINLFQIIFLNVIEDLASNL